MRTFLVYITSYIFKSPYSLSTVQNMSAGCVYGREQRRHSFFSRWDECSGLSNPPNALFCPHINAYKTYWLVNFHRVGKRRKKPKAGPKVPSLCKQYSIFFSFYFYYLFAHLQIFITCYPNLMALLTYTFNLLRVY